MLEKFLVSKVRIKLLKLYLSDPSQSYHVRGITRLLDEEINAVRRELERMAKVKLVRSERKGNRLYYSVRTDFQYYNEFLALIQKEFGLGQEIIKSAKKLGDVSYAWLTKFYTKQVQKGPNDVDLVVIGDKIDFGELARHVKSAEEETGRQINYTVMGLHEFDLRKQRRDKFVMDLFLSSRVMLVGDEDKMLL